MEVKGLIAGLGNPGPQYDGTRHNIGFMAIDALHERLAKNAFGRAPLETPQDISGVKHRCELWKAQHNGSMWLFCKPQTFMNLSGESIASLARFYRIPAESILVVHDELDIPLGRMRAKSGGGPAGHNGLKSIVNVLGTNEFNRLRIGIGKPEKGEVINWVLSRFSVSDRALVEKIVQAATDVMLIYMESGIKKAMQKASEFHQEATSGHSDKM